MRVWILDAPNGVLTSSGKQQLALGLTLGTSVAEAENLENYFRRYLSDPTSIQPVGPSISIAAGTEDADTEYVRRYLGDPV